MYNEIRDRTYQQHRSILLKALAQIHSMDVEVYDEERNRVIRIISNEIGNLDRIFEALKK